MTLAMKLRLFAVCLSFCSEGCVLCVCDVFDVEIFSYASLSCAETTVSKSFTGLLEQNDSLHI